MLLLPSPLQDDDFFNSSFRVLHRNKLFHNAYFFYHGHHLHQINRPLRYKHYALLSFIRLFIQRYIELIRLDFVEKFTGEGHLEAVLSLTTLCERESAT